MSTALLTDHYELTMVAAARRSGMADRRCVFEVFTRRLPEGRRYGVVMGLGRVTEAIEQFRFGVDALEYLTGSGIIDDDTATWLADYRFAGDIVAYREGEVYFADSPVLTIEGTFAEATLLETLVLSIFNHDSAIGSAAARMVSVAHDRPIMEFGARRTHEHAAVAAARAAYLAGFAGTSNLEAGRRYGIPTLGTSAHSFTLVHDDEETAFKAQVATFGPGTTALIDTFDEERAVERAVGAAGRELGGVRIDSGDLAAISRRVRRKLDDLGATGTRIVASGDLDEKSLRALADAPIDAYGIGTALVTGAGAPTAEFIYKLVAREGVGGTIEPVAKTSSGKATLGGRKWAARVLEDGKATEERLSTTGPPSGRALQVEVVRAGVAVHDPDLQQIRSHHRSAMAELPRRALDIRHGRQAIPTVHEGATK